MVVGSYAEWYEPSPQPPVDIRNLAWRSSEDVDLNALRCSRVLGDCSKQLPTSRECNQGSTQTTSQDDDGGAVMLGFR